MNYDIKYNTGDNYFLIQTHGDFDINDFKELAIEMLTHTNWVPGANCLFDYRMTNMLGVARQDFENASAMHRENNSVVGNGKSALVMKDVGNYGMGRMYQNTTEGHVDTQFQIFSDYNHAKEWITTV